MALVFFFFTFTISFLLLFSLLRFIFMKFKPLCHCDLCDTLFNSKWTLEFDNLCDWYTHLLQKSPTKTIHFHVLNNIITSNPQNVEYILRTKFDNYPKGQPFSTILGDLLGHGIFNVDGDLWKFQRKMANLQLRTSSAKSFAFDTVNIEIKSRLIPLLNTFSSEKERILDLQEVFGRFSIDVICNFSFGFDPDSLKSSLPVSELAIAFDIASKLSALRAMSTSPFVWKIKRLLNIGSEKKLKQAINFVDVLAKEVIENKRRNGFSSHKDLLSGFMAAIDDDQKHQTHKTNSTDIQLFSSRATDDKFLRDIVVSFLLAGLDTIASGLTSIFLLLTQNPEVIENIRIESNRIMGSNYSQELASYEQLQKMHYLQAATYEGLRLYPPVQFDSKFCVKDDNLPDGTFVKKGTRVTYHPYAMGRMQNIWGSDFLEFKPERWFNEDGVFRPANPFDYPVFQAGVRVCLGKEMALMEIKSVVLAIVREFNVEMALPVSKNPRFLPGLTATLKGGLPVFIERRNQPN